MSISFAVLEKQLTVRVNVTKNTKQKRLYREKEEIYQEIKVFSLLDGRT